MYTKRKRAELITLLYMTVNNEISKPVDGINTELVDTCIEFGDLLAGKTVLSDERSAELTRKIFSRAELQRKRKRLKARILVAVIAALILLGTIVYAFSGRLFDIFGAKKVAEIQPGEVITAEQNEVEAPEAVIYFDTLEELTEYLDEPIYLPTELPDGFELTETRIEQYDCTTIDVTWRNHTNTINCRIKIKPSYFNEDGFKSHENEESGYEYYSLDGYPFNFIQVDTYWQAIGWIADDEYIILASRTELLEEYIDAMRIS